MAGPFPIPLKTITEYSTLIGYTTQEDLTFFLEVIHACDMAYLKKAAEDAKASQASAKSSSSAGVKR